MIAMIECPIDHPKLPNLFDPNVPNNPALWAVFLGRHSGRALVDDRDHPGQCLLRTDAYLTYASRHIRIEFLAQAVDYFRHAGPMWLVRMEGDPPAPISYKTLPRLEFTGYVRFSKQLINLRKRLPDGYAIKPIDMDLLQRCEWREDMIFYCGSLENFLRHDLGVCLMHGDEIITEAYASAFGIHSAEIGAITHEAHRGRGFAAITVAYLIEMVEQRGYHAYWSCDLDNPASASVARKLGFKVERPYEIFEYGKRSEL